MFGLKKFAKTKTKIFKSEKERKRYFAIQDYYRSNSANTTSKSKNAKK